MEAFLSFCETNLHLQSFELALVLVGVVFFCLFWFLMHCFLFRPYLSLIEAREDATVNAVTRAKKATLRAEEINQEFEDLLNTTRSDALKKKGAKLVAAKQKADELLSQASAAASAEISQGRAEFTSRVDTVKEDILKNVDQLAHEMVDKIYASAEGR